MHYFSGITCYRTSFKICSEKSQPLFDDQQNTLADLNGTINELYDGYNEILSYNQQEHALKRFEKIMRECVYLVLRHNLYQV